MKTTLVIYSSPTIGSKVGSISELIAQKFIDEYQKHNNDEIIHMDLNEEKMASKTMTSKSFATFFNEKDSFYYIDQLKNIDKVIVVAPMTNFNYPAVLKNYLDHILIGGKTFKYKYDSNGESVGLLSHLKVQIITTQGADFGWYPWGNVAKMLEGTWKFMGAKIVESLTIYGTKTPAKSNLSIEEVVAPYLDKIKTAAKSF